MHQVKKEDLAMANLNKTGVVFDIQSFSTHDGPGIRTIVFLKGCQLRCHWCANPEGQNVFPEVFYHAMNCVGCFECIQKCPLDAITRAEDEQKNKGFIRIDRSKCRHCPQLDCVQACFNDALKITGKIMRVDEVMKPVMRDKPYFRDNGGITLSGGDPFFQHDFAMEILKACKENYIHTAIETEAFAAYEKIEATFPYVDLYLCDLKIMDPAKHQQFTGVSNKRILENIKKMAAAVPSKVLIRVPVIPGCTDDVENIRAIAAFTRENNLTRIHLLPYHKLGQPKFEQLGREYPMPDVQPPDKGQMEALKQVVEEEGVVCVVG